jgi:uncharacterized protein
MNASTQPFWEATRIPRLVGCKCASCHTFRMPPSPFCPNCLSQLIDWVPLAGKGTIYSYTICRRSPYPKEVEDFVYIPIVVELPDAPGTRLVSTLVDADPAVVSIGQQLVVGWNPIQGGWNIPIFRLSE